MISSNNTTIEHESFSSLDQVNGFCKNLVSNGNTFAGYLKNMSQNEANKLGLSSKNFEGHLIFRKKNFNEDDSPNSFIFNHLIHVIIYQGRSRCRMNLSQKFM